MKRSLIYFFILTLFAWSTLFSLAYLTQPVDENGQSNNALVITFLGVGYIAIMLLVGFILSLVKTFLPDRKLPHLLFRDSLIHGAIISVAATGILALQLMRAFTAVNAVLWIAIVGATAWIVEASRQSSSEKTSSPPDRVTMKKVTKNQK